MWRSLVILIGLLIATPTLAQDFTPDFTQDFTYPRLRVSRHASPQARAAADLFRDEMKARTGVTLERIPKRSSTPVKPVQRFQDIEALQNNSPQRVADRVRSDLAVRRTRPLLLIARRSQVADLLPSTQIRAWRRWLISAPAQRPEAYSLISLGNTLIIAGDDDRGILFGVGHLLRKLQMSEGLAIFSAPLNVRAEPQMAYRAHQIGYRYKNNSYDAFTLAMFEQHIRDLVVFGSNAIQWIAPISDDLEVSPLFPAPAMETLIGVSKLTARYGIDFDLYYPEMAKSYADPAMVAEEIRRFEDLVKRVPKIDALYVPGGDPGHTEPDLLFPLVAQQVIILHKYHPKATVWISAQGFDRAQYERFYALLNERPDWLTGVFFGPQSRDSLPVQRARIPKRYRMIFYPDIAHTLHSQFPVPKFDPALALTEGREPVNPQPRAQSHIIRHFAPFYDGFVTYSEGVTDDVNKMIWSQAGWTIAHDPLETLADYGRYFIGDARFGQGLAMLERNWEGSVAENKGISETLPFFETFKTKASWRYEMALYRAIYDAYVQRRLKQETARRQAACKALKRGDTAGVRLAFSTPDDTETLAMRARLFDLADRLYAHIGLQLSVLRYGASLWERGANLDRIDVSLNDRVWILKQLDEIEALRDPALKKARLAALAMGDEAPAGGFYDDLGDPQNEPHLVRGQGFERDPEFYQSAIDGIADVTPDDGWRMAWITYAETLYEQPLEMQYDRLDASARYRLKIIYAGEGYALPIRLLANDVTLLHDFTQRISNPMTLEIDVPHNATKGGRLNLKWTRPEGLGGSGRGRQVAQVWLWPVKPNE